MPSYELEAYIESFFSDYASSRLVFKFCQRNFKNKRPCGKDYKVFNMKPSDVFIHPEFAMFLKTELPAYFKLCSLLTINEKLSSDIESLALSEQF